MFNLRQDVQFGVSRDNSVPQTLAADDARNVAETERWMLVLVSDGEEDFEGATIIGNIIGWLVGVLAAHSQMKGRLFTVAHQHLIL